ncbi:UDP-N-acetylmuramoyl-tripeptide--D-alanyl-D-alanine ligase [bacterium]|nr:UDP-N-acetylmuramoyl-tripeptide--D-alanyl-D-alanine ligase [bacterium]
MMLTQEMLREANIEVWGGFNGKLPPVSIDTRSMKVGDLFWALRGEKFDAHEFIKKAFAHGASMAAVDRKWSEQLRGIPPPQTLLVMDDTLKGMQVLAKVVRKNIGSTVCAITGSYAKTTTRELVAKGLATSGKVMRSPKNYNNEIGLPYTLLNLDGDEKYVVLEMGANHAGEISKLCEIGDPHFGMVTTIAHVHLEGFHSIEGVQKAKGEMYQHLLKDGFALVNLDDERVVEASGKNSRKAGYTMQGIPDDWQHSIYHGHLVGLDAWSRASLNVEGMTVKLQLPGKHFAQTALGAYAMCVEAGVEPDQALQAIASVEPIAGRGKIIQLERGIELLDESYNASVPTMEAALRTPLNRNGSRIAVLGDMYELGLYEEDEHRSIGRLDILEEYDMIIFYGNRMAWAFEEAEMMGVPSQLFVDETPEELAEKFAGEIPDDAAVVVKGSNASGLSRFVKTLEEIAGSN